MDTETYGLIGMLGITAVLLWYIMRLRKDNISDSIENNQPHIAGDDVLGGSAINPHQFDEPDEETLDMLGDLLEEAAEAQGLTYEE
ncbi:MAG: hypothetical protein ACJZ49_05820 [Candidatus Thalassarchaeaceae archaeon]|nr:MAG: hypothetical protein CMA04_001425 [Euryarchaeota archaeon]RPG74062.1 MAG: hypothetical protein CBC45_005380 [Euryarchaeota archaeon TMED85]|tara:strand:- start:114 stop:371 length:258 start_codon:yes stop_codon:yes gene_type:complete